MVTLKLAARWGLREAGYDNPKRNGGKIARKKTL